MNGLGADSGNASMTTFLVSELRDMRRGQESSMAMMTTKLTEMSHAILSLGTKFDSSNASLKEVKEEVGQLGKRVGAIETLRGNEAVAKKAAWSGPRKVMTILAAIGSGIGGLVALKYLWPLLVAL